MTAADFVKSLNRRSPRRNLQEIYDGVRRRLAPTVDSRESVYDREWDVLVILDACRADTFEQIAEPVIRESEIMELHESTEIPSIASQSREWLQKTFIEEYCLDVSCTAYVTGNVFTQEVFGSVHPFVALEEVWETAWDVDAGTVPAGPVVEAAMPFIGDGSQASKVDRVIVHLMQPHFPSVPDSLMNKPVDARELDEVGGNDVPLAWKKLRERTISRDRVLESYEANLKYALEEIKPLIESASGRVVLSADHGQAFGEWGQYGHPEGVRTEQIVRVPWAVVQERKPQYKRQTSGSVDAETEEKLKALGYT